MSCPFDELKLVVTMDISISNEAAEFIAGKGGQIIIFRGCLTGCCVGKVPAPMIEVGKPRRPLDNYDVVKYESGVTVYFDKDLASCQGTCEITLAKNLWWKSLSFKYQGC